MLWIIFTDPHAVQYLKLCHYFYIVSVHLSLTVYFGFEFLIRNSSDLSPYIWQWTGLHYRSSSCWYDHLLNICYAFMLVIVFNGRPFVRFALCYRSVVLSVCLSVCDVGVLWPNGWTDQDETWRAGRPRPWPHFVRWGPSSPSPKGAQPPILGPYLLRPNGCMDQDVTWYGGRPRLRRLCL